MPHPFETSIDEIRENLDLYVDEVFTCLQSDFLVMPKGSGFIEYPIFEKGYETLKMATGNFRTLNADSVAAAVNELPISLIVLRTILGLTPPEWAYVTTELTDIEVSQNAARAIDRKIRMAPEKSFTKKGGVTQRRVEALIETACSLLQHGAPKVPEEMIHRLQKADTAAGVASLQPLADLGVPYAMMLYERFLGRPFASHRDSVSELIGDVIEIAIEGVLHRSGVSFRKTKRAERIEGLDQAPDFIIPDEFNPKVVIEAKLTEDDGTARDKVTRVQHLAQLATEGQLQGKPKFEVVACIDGRGFGIRRELMKMLILATRGKVFTLQNIEQLVECTDAKNFRTIKG